VNVSRSRARADDRGEREPIRRSARERRLIDARTSARPRRRRNEPREQAIVKKLPAANRS
jgi:hypothetical protein